MCIGCCTRADACTNLGCEAICEKLVSLKSVASRQKWWRPNFDLIMD